MKLKIHLWQNKEAHYASFEFTPSEYYVVKSMDVHENEYQYSLNPKLEGDKFYGKPVIFIEKEEALRLIKDLHFVQVHNKDLYTNFY